MTEKIITELVVMFVIMISGLVGAIVYIIKRVIPSLIEKIIPSKVEAMSKQLTENDLNHIWKAIDELRHCDIDLKSGIADVKGDLGIAKADILGLRRDQDHLERRVERWINEK
jgi:uncharacterized membrane protein